MPGFVLFIFFCFLTVWSTQLNAIEIQPGARAAGLGDAYTAVATSPDTLSRNPAGIVLLPRLAFGTSYVYTFGEDTHRVQGFALDSKMWPLGVALTYNFSGTHLFQTQSLQSHAGGLTLAYPFADRAFAIGATLHILNKAQTDMTQSITEPVLDLGLWWKWPAGLTWGLAVQSVTWNTPLERLLPSTGLSLNMGSLSRLWSEQRAAEAQDWLDTWIIAFDYRTQGIRTPTWQHELSLGSEIVLFDLWPLRLGVQHETTLNKTYGSFGTGLLFEQFAIHIAWQHHWQTYNVWQGHSVYSSIQLLIP